MFNYYTPYSNGRIQAEQSSTFSNRYNIMNGGFTFVTIEFSDSFPLTEAREETIKCFVDKLNQKVWDTFLDRSAVKSKP